MRVLKYLGKHADRLAHLSNLDYYDRDLNNDANELGKLIHHVIEGGTKNVCG